jgi:osmotically-inducible protein OsmY
MKKRNVFIAYLLFLTLIATSAVWASAFDGEEIDDMTLGANVLSALDADDSLRSFNITVETRNGVVILNGWVNSQDALIKAGQIAQSVKGTQSVKNNLSVK